MEVFVFCRFFSGKTHLCLSECADNYSSFHQREFENDFFFFFLGDCEERQNVTALSVSPTDRPFTEFGSFKSALL